MKPHKLGLIGYFPKSLTFSAIDAAWLARPSSEIASDLLGCVLVRRYANDQIVRALIVEAEAYTPGDPACHAYRRRTPRNAVMFGPAGLTYVYLIYGMYHCLNVVTDQDGTPSAVLLRAAELDSIPMPLPPSQRRSPHRAAAGPGKLCRILDIDRTLTAHPLQPGGALWLQHRSPAFERDVKAGRLTIVQTTRIGLSQGQDLPWRWYVNESPAVSKR